MECNATVNISCDFNSYLVCQMPTNTVEVELKIKTTWGKYTLNKNMCTRRERYHPLDRADRRTKIHTKKRRKIRREADTETITTSSETDIQDGEGFSYPAKIFTNPEFAKTILLTELDDGEIEVIIPNFIGEACSKCAKKYERCWCYKLDWDDELLEIETPKDPTERSNNPQKVNVTVVPMRQPPSGWVEYRGHVMKQTTNNSENSNSREDNPIEKLIIKGIRSITTKKFEEM